MSLPIWTWIPLGFIVFSVAVDIIALAVTFRERRPIWPFEPLLDSEPTGSAESSRSLGEPHHAYRSASDLSDAFPISPQAMRHGADFNQLGYEYLGAYRHIKRGVYHIRYDAMISPDRFVLVMISSGTIIKLPANNVTMVSLGIPRESVTGEREPNSLHGIISITNESAFGYDFLDRTSTMVFPGATAVELQNLHARRWNDFRPRRFGPDPMKEYQYYCMVNADEAEQNGLVRRVDEDPNMQLAYPWPAFVSFVAMKRFMYGRRLWPHRWRVKKELPDFSTWE
ncbi:hypothetical protein Pla22_35030 [Rubripirellula amarantea]|uniref:Uncharacterized protein n=1 Tax=Rubripirellula amarantea TaxID=2527999 RepID=A0A5C5WJD6_9BACT|nr:hypothetical protein [Rubripirellula amarantea]TWT50760.1 hypothetical protein Pla22_35030 [Rubripirellula amarantea]